MFPNNQLETAIFRHLLNTKEQEEKGKKSQ